MVAVRRTSITQCAAVVLVVCAGCAGDDAGRRDAYADRDSASAADGFAGADGATANTSVAGAAGTGDTSAVALAPEAHIERADTVVDQVALACGEPCVEVRAVAAGGHPPYDFEWEDGSTDPTREICPRESGVVSVTITDTAIDDPEFPRAAESSVAQLLVIVPTCGGSDACALADDASMPASGHYEGTMSCTAGDGAMILDLDVDPSRTEQVGDVSFQWVLLVIGAEGTMQGIVDCDAGGLRMTWTGLWGVPFGPDPNEPGEPFNLLPVGPVTGEFTMVRDAHDPDTISGEFDWLAPAVVPGQKMDSQCNAGTFTATRTP